MENEREAELGKLKFLKALQFLASKSALKLVLLTLILLLPLASDEILVTLRREKPSSLSTLIITSGS